MIKTKTRTSRNLRKQSTPWERKLWSVLRNRQFEGFKFRRQHLVGPYVVDICCSERRLIIELDGGQHNEISNIKSDLIRQKYLEEKGYIVLRIWNNELDNNLEGVAEKIHLTLDPSPQSGEGKGSILVTSPLERGEGQGEEGDEVV